MTGQTISHYGILEKLGGGGMGVVYKAEGGQTIIRQAPGPPRLLRRFVFPGVAIAAILTVVLVFYFTRGHKWPRGAATPARIGSLAVLPLANLSGDPAQEYFADGMTDALIAAWRKSGPCA